MIAEKEGGSADTTDDYEYTAWGQLKPLLTRLKKEVLNKKQKILGIMDKQQPSHPQAKEIEQLIEQLNHCWINKKFEDMEPFFHKQVVLLQPGDNHRISGREQMIESYWEFMETAKVSDFKIADESINVFDETAVAYYTFRIHYKVENTRYDETGSEILVFQRHNNHWNIVWRTQLPAS